jgi:hypothetical protein
MPIEEEEDEEEDEEEEEEDDEEEEEFVLNVGDRVSKSQKRKVKLWVCKL